MAAMVMVAWVRIPVENRGSENEGCYIHDVLFRVFERLYLGGAFTLTQPWWSFRFDVYSILGPTLYTILKAVTKTTILCAVLVLCSFDPLTFGPLCGLFFLSSSYHNSERNGKSIRFIQNFHYYYLLAPVVCVVQVMMILYDQKTGRILSSNVITFSSMYSKRFQLKPRPVSWLNNRTKNVDAAVAGSRDYRRYRRIPCSLSYLIREGGG
uniref:Uncharacterized protein n=1 Tax=Tanacetum cinerariifolium TaxID=118510 RepID=A0A6L2L4A9_TANCI|nr:hypothetical protein [Tanacetum cinerariifolium]